MTDQQLVFEWARWCVEARGLAVFLLATDSSGGKRPTGNCTRCREGEGYDGHDRDGCGCLLCHGFYAATGDMERFAYMLRALPNGYLAVRTGNASGVFVIDAEATNKHDDPTLPAGIEVVDGWEQWVPGGWSLPPTLTARSVSGGTHLYYAAPPDRMPGCPGYVLPSVEVKGQGGYVAAPCGRNDRAWLDPHVPIAPTPNELLDWLGGPARSGTRPGRPGFAGAAAGGNGPLPPTEAFLEHGFGWFTGSRNKDCFRLAWRLWGQLLTEDEVFDIITRCWERTANKPGSPRVSLEHFKGTARSARRRWRQAHDEELALVESYRGGRW